ncbi:TonB-dependent receptor plug domain-containing protein [Pseudomonas rhizophila]|uniref:TonB-dependent receptor plug domain-containing protein n=1 Tax=Pseudomonas rhizophila TaxID=2045200 RepID=UPI0030D6DA4B
MSLHPTATLLARYTLQSLCVSGIWLLARAAAAQDLTVIPFEQLLETKVVGAAQFSQQLTDAPSAVSVVTAEEIQRFGYRTLGEILNNMRGLNVGFDGLYYFLGGRGYGAPGEYAGRVMLRIDGQAVADNVFNQIYLGEDGLLDTELIDRVEYAPGPGSALYGNGAFLGVINVVTLRGRDLEGSQVAMTAGSNQERKVRASWGARLDNGGEWLVSTSASQAELPGTPLADGALHDDQDGKRLFIKGSQDAWSFEGAFVERGQQELTVPLDAHLDVSDCNDFLKLGHDADFGSFRSSVRLSHGRYLYRSAYREPIDDGRRYIEDYRVDGRWWDLEGTVSSVALSGHRLVLGSEYRNDYRQDQQSYLYFPRRDEHETYHSETSTQTFSLYAQDEIALRHDLSLNLGVRMDQRSGKDSVARSNPRVALLYTGLTNTNLSLSHGSATRFASRYETTFNDLPSVQSERVTTTEFVADHRRGDFRLLGTLYRYRITDPIGRFSEPTLERIDTQGAELEAQWQWREVQLRGSHTLQGSEDNLGRDRVNSPRHMRKLQVSVPLMEERLRASLAARYVGRRLVAPGVSASGYTITDLTFTSRDVVPGVSVTAAVRNLFDRRYLGASSVDIESSAYLPERGERSLWLSVGYAFP